MQVYGDDGILLDAEIEVALVNDNFSITIESRGPGRNTDYIPAFKAIVQRLWWCQATLLDAFVSSTAVAGLPIEKRRLLATGSFPKDLREIADIASFAHSLRMGAAPVGSPAGRRGGGNATKRVTIVVDRKTSREFDLPAMRRHLQVGRSSIQVPASSAETLSKPAPVANTAEGSGLDDIVVPVPERVARPGVRATAPSPRKVDYASIDAANKELGDRGEEFVLLFEKERLIKSGKPDLADRVEWVSKTRGDGLGFDVLSFELDETERCIEVKTTSSGSVTPFTVTANEVKRSGELGRRFWLYRVFDFGTRPRMYLLQGPLADAFELEASQFVARLRNE